MPARQAADFIARLFQACLKVDTDSYPLWALEQLGSLIPYDAALYGVGNLHANRYHAVHTLGLPKTYVSALEGSAQKSVLLPLLIQNLGQPINSALRVADEQFYGSEFYRQIWQPASIERVLTIAFVDTDNGLYSHIALYRNDREQPFSPKETELFGLITPHLPQASSHAFLLRSRLIAENPTALVAVALCDKFGIIHDVAPEFSELMQTAYPGWRGPGLPAELAAAVYAEHCEQKLGRLMVQVKPFAKLRLLLIRGLKKRDSLSDREQEVLERILKGLSYKEVARQLDIAASTVSTLVCRAYLKLGVNSRRELLKLADSEVGVAEREQTEADLLPTEAGILSAGAHATR